MLCGVVEESVMDKWDSGSAIKLQDYGLPWGESVSWFLLPLYPYPISVVVLAINTYHRVECGLYTTSYLDFI